MKTSKNASGLLRWLGQNDPLFSPLTSACEWWEPTLKITRSPRSMCVMYGCRLCVVTGGGCFSTFLALTTVEGSGSFWPSCLNSPGDIRLNIHKRSRALRGVGQCWFTSAHERWERWASTDSQALTSVERSGPYWFTSAHERWEECGQLTYISTARRLINDSFTDFRTNVVLGIQLFWVQQYIPPQPLGFFSSAPCAKKKHFSWIKTPAEWVVCEPRFLCQGRTPLHSWMLGPENLESEW